MSSVTCRECGLILRYDVAPNEVLSWAWARGWHVDWRSGTTWCPEHDPTKETTA
jgi:hypothetical protein